MILKNIHSFFEALLPGIKKKEILEALYSNYGELESINVPMYNLNFKIVPSNTSEMLRVRFKNQLDFGNVNNIHGTIRGLLESMSQDQEVVIRAVKEAFGDAVPKATTDYYLLNLFKYTESIAFVTQYTRRLLNVLAWESLIQTLTDKSKTDSVYIEILPGSKSELAIIASPAIKADREYVCNSSNIVGFITAANMLNKPFAKYEKSIQSLKGHLVREEDWDGSNKIGERMLDPYDAGFIPVPINPFYHIGIAFTTWRVHCNERNKADLGRIQLMLSLLNDKRSRTAEDDVRTLRSLDKQINYYDEVSNTLSAKIEDMEGSRRG